MASSTSELFFWHDFPHARFLGKGDENFGDKFYILEALAIALFEADFRAAKKKNPRTPVGELEEWRNQNMILTKSEQGKALIQARIDELVNIFPEKRINLNERKDCSIILPYMQTALGSKYQLFTFTHWNGVLKHIWKGESDPSASPVYLLVDMDINSNVDVLTSLMNKAGKFFCGACTKFGDREGRHKCKFSGPKCLSPDPTLCKGELNMECLACGSPYGPFETTGCFERHLSCPKFHKTSRCMAVSKCMEGCGRVIYKSKNKHICSHKFCKKCLGMRPTPHDCVAYSFKGIRSIKRAKESLDREGEMARIKKIEEEKARESRVDLVSETSHPEPCDSDDSDSDDGRY